MKDEEILGPILKRLYPDSSGPGSLPYVCVLEAMALTREDCAKWHDDEVVACMAHANTARASGYGMESDGYKRRARWHRAASAHLRERGK